MDITQYLDPETIALLQTGGYFFMLGLMIIEWPVVAFVWGFLAYIGFFSLPMVILMGFLGDAIGDVVYYILWHTAEKHTYTKRLLQHHKTVYLREKISKNLLAALMIIKFTPNLAPAGLTLIGAMRISFQKYIRIAAPLCIILPSMLASLGYYSGRILPYFPKDWNIVYLIPIIAIIGWVVAMTTSRLVQWLVAKLTKNTSI